MYLKTTAHFAKSTFVLSFISAARKSTSNTCLP